MTIQDQHRTLYPEQYNHPAVGRRIRHGDKVGTIHRVVRTRFGLLAHSDVFEKGVAYALNSLSFVN